MHVNVFEEMRKGAAYDIMQEDYVEQVHSELNRCAGLCQKINATDVSDKESISTIYLECVTCGST